MQQKFILTFVGLIIVLSFIQALDIGPKEQRLEPNRLQPERSRIIKRVNRANNNKQQQDSFDQNQNEIDDSGTSSSWDPNQRYILAEPFKSLVQTTTRYALAQTTMPNHMSIDTAMSLLSDVAYFLSKPINMLKAMKLVTIFIASSLGLYMVPGGSDFIGSLWQNPSDALNLDNYLSNGLSERSVLDVVSARTDEALSSVGLEANFCREKSLCHLGEILHCFLPNTSQTIIKFARENFSSNSNGLKEHPMTRAFVTGFVDRNCTRISAANQGNRMEGLSVRSASQQSSNCLGKFLVSVLSAGGFGNETYSTNNKQHAKH